MFVMIKSKSYLLLGCCSILLGLVSFANVHADTLDNGLKEWDPSVIQGTIMDNGKDFIVIYEQRIMLIDTTVKGKHFETSIMDSRGADHPKSVLKKGVLVLAKGGLAWDERIKANVLLATEIQILDRPVNLEDEKIRKKMHEQSKPW